VRGLWLRGGPEHDEPGQGVKSNFQAAIMARDELAPKWKGRASREARPPL